MAIRKLKNRSIAEFGDFQTPPHLALRAMELLKGLNIRARSILEPTCGRGSFVSAAAACFPQADLVIGIEINEGHLKAAQAAVPQKGDRHVHLQQGDFFKVDWRAIVDKAVGPWLIVGNPPWVTSSELGAIESDNLPEKSNFHGRAGIEAITGKSNFDISEWMLLRYLDWLESTEGTIAVLCKTAVARKILTHIWKRGHNYPHSARIYKIDALSHFGAAVDACFFVLELKAEGQAVSCDVFNSMDATTPSKTLGFVDGNLICDVAAFNNLRQLLGPDHWYVWRSGVKHDCSKVMELATTDGKGYLNGLGETVFLEDEFVFPMLKSSDIGNGRLDCRSVMLVTQHAVGEDTSYIKGKAPKTWAYLKKHAALLDKRGSVIYKNTPPFSIFGIGPYSFAPWKVAISGFYKKLHFLKVGPVDGKPVVLDDTVYFLACWSEQEADFIETLLRSQAAQEFFHSMVHWDEKRPITAEILKRLNIRKLAAMLGREPDYHRFREQKELPLFA